MMKSYEATATIRATPQEIWAVLTNVADYPAWDPGMVRVEGALAPGARVKFFTKFSPNQAFAVKVTGFEPGKRMVLTGGMPLGLFKSERTHTLTANRAGETVFHTRETFSGLLFPLFGAKIPDLTESFEAFVAGLKGRVENGR